MSTTYINSKVSLVSKSMIRYEGTLFSINAEEATITLSNVKSFGTETRKADKFIPPRDAIFEYIIFKATDIKDLIVDEPLVNEFNDPAILQAHTSLSTATSGSNENKSLALNGISEQANVFNGNQATNVPSVQSAGQTDRFGFRSRGSTPSSSQPRSPVSEISSQKQKSDKQIGQKLQQNNSNNFNKNHNNRRRLDNQQNYHNNNNQRFDGRQNRPYINNHNNLNNNRRPVNYYQNNKYQNNYNRSGQNFHRTDDLMNSRLGNLVNRNGMKKPRVFNSNNNNKGPRKFDIKLKTEFDFEKANQVFKQMVDKLGELDVSFNGEKSEKSTSEEVKEEGKNTIVSKDEDETNFYDKRKSFFDNISCEAIERSKGKKNRFDWKQERKLNAETFGLQLNYRRTDFNQGFRARPGYNNNRNNRRFNSGNIRQPRTNSS